jgi:hypothetical protein
MMMMMIILILVFFTASVGKGTGQIGVGGTAHLRKTPAQHLRSTSSTILGELQLDMSLEPAAKSQRGGLYCVYCVFIVC